MYNTIIMRRFETREFNVQEWRLPVEVTRDGMPAVRRSHEQLANLHAFESIQLFNYSSYNSKKSLQTCGYFFVTLICTFMFMLCFQLVFQ